MKYLASFFAGCVFTLSSLHLIGSFEWSNKFWEIIEEKDRELIRNDSYIDDLKKDIKLLKEIKQTEERELFYKICL